MHRIGWKWVFYGDVPWFSRCSRRTLGDQHRNLDPHCVRLGWMIDKPRSDVDFIGLRPIMINEIVIFHIQPHVLCGLLFPFGCVSLSILNAYQAYLSAGVSGPGPRRVFKGIPPTSWHFHNQSSRSLACSWPLLVPLLAVPSGSLPGIQFLLSTARSIKSVFCTSGDDTPPFLRSRHGRFTPPYSTRPIFVLSRRVLAFWISISVVPKKTFIKPALGHTSCAHEVLKRETTQLIFPSIQYQPPLPHHFHRNPLGHRQDCDPKLAAHDDQSSWGCYHPID